MPSPIVRKRNDSNPDASKPRYQATPAPRTAPRRGSFCERTIHEARELADSQTVNVPRRNDSGIGGVVIW